MYDQGYGMYDGRQYKPYKVRGGCLLIWLIFVIGTSFLGFLFIIGGGPQRVIAELDIPYMPEFPAWHWTYAAISNLAFVICGIGIWLWKRWGFSGYVCLFILDLIVAFVGGIFDLSLLVGNAIAIGIAWYVVSPYWEDME